MGDKMTGMTPNFAKAKRKVMGIIQTEDIGELKILFDQYKQELIKEFFVEEGFAILKWSLAYVSDPRVLAFLVDNLPCEILSKLLQENDFEILESFLMSEAGGERFGQSEQRQSRIEKFKLLLAIDKEAMKEFMSKHKDKKYITKKISEDFDEAQRQMFKSSISSKLTL